MGVWVGQPARLRVPHPSPHPAPRALRHLRCGMVHVTCFTCVAAHKGRVGAAPTERLMR